MAELRSLKRRAGVAEEALRIKKEWLDEAEQEHEEEYSTLTYFSKQLEEKWEQRFDALARLAQDAGMRHEDVEAVRMQPWRAAARMEQAMASAREAAAAQQAASEREVAAEREAAAEREVATEREARAASAQQMQRISQQLEQRTAQLKAAQQKMAEVTAQKDLLNRRVRELEAAAELRVAAAEKAAADAEAQCHKEIIHQSLPARCSTSLLAN